MEAQVVGAAALGAAGATGVLLALARRGAAPWLQNRKQKAESTNGSLLSDEQSPDSGGCVCTACLCSAFTYRPVASCLSRASAGTFLRPRQDACYSQLQPTVNKEGVRTRRVSRCHIMHVAL